MMTQEYNKYKLYCDCCDNCLEFDSFERDIKYCPNCGQALDWRND